MKTGCRENRECELHAVDFTRVETKNFSEGRGQDSPDGTGGRFQQHVAFSVVPFRKNYGVHTRPGTVETKETKDEQQGREIEELQAKCENLEKKIAALVLDRDRKTESLAETRIALHVLLGKNDETARQVEEKILFNVEKFVVPYLQKLEMECGNESQKVLLKVVQSNLNQITSSFAFSDKHNFAKLTPTQIQVMDLVKCGHSTKEIAAILHLSPATVASHRQEIRKRLSLNNKKINLYTALNLLAGESEI